MAKAFPGIDPFVEDQGFWRDFHLTYLVFLRSAIAKQLPDHYEVWVEGQVVLSEPDWSDSLSRQVGPDVLVARRSDIPLGALHPQQEIAGIVTLEPVTITLPVYEEVTERWVAIRHRPDRSLVTTLELLSPSNKQGDGRGAYVAKRNALLADRMNLVEFDLLRHGQRLPMRSPLPPADYYALVSRADERPRTSVYAWGLRDRLPAIPIPLKTPDPDITVDLAAVYAIVYEEGHYERAINYRKQLSRSSAEDADWAVAVAESRDRLVIEDASGRE